MGGLHFLGKSTDSTVPTSAEEEGMADCHVLDKPTNSVGPFSAAAEVWAHATPETSILFRKFQRRSEVVVEPPTLPVVTLAHPPFPMVRSD